VEGGKPGAQTEAQPTERKRTEQKTESYITEPKHWTNQLSPLPPNQIPIGCSTAKLIQDLCNDENQTTSDSEIVEAVVDADAVAARHLLLPRSHSPHSPDSLRFQCQLLHCSLQTQRSQLHRSHLSRVCVFSVPAFPSSLVFSSLSLRRSQEDDNQGERWVEIISWEPRAFLYHNFLVSVYVNAISICYQDVKFCMLLWFLGFSMCPLVSKNLIFIFPFSSPSFSFYHNPVEIPISWIEELRAKFEIFLSSPFCSIYWNEVLFSILNTTLAWYGYVVFNHCLR